MSALPAPPELPEPDRLAQPPARKGLLVPAKMPVLAEPEPVRQPSSTWS